MVALLCLPTLDHATGKNAYQDVVVLVTAVDSDPELRQVGVASLAGIKWSISGYAPLLLKDPPWITWFLHGIQPDNIAPESDDHMAAFLGGSKLLTKDYRTQTRGDEQLQLWTVLELTQARGSPPPDSGDAAQMLRRSQVALLTSFLQNEHVPILFELLTPEEDSEVRWKAAEGLRVFAQDEQVDLFEPRFVALVEDSDPRVRMQYCLAIDPLRQPFKSNLAESLDKAVNIDGPKGEPRHDAGAEGTFYTTFEILCRYHSQAKDIGERMRIKDQMRQLIDRLGRWGSRAPLLAIADRLIKYGDTTLREEVRAWVSALPDSQEKAQFMAHVDSAPSD